MTTAKRIASEVREGVIVFDKDTQAFFTNDGNSWEEITNGGGGGTFTKYSVSVADSPYTIPSWDSIVEVHNDTGSIELILPAMDEAGDIGKEIKLWFEHNTANHKVTVKSPNTSGSINYVPSEGAEVAKAEYTANEPSFKRVTMQLMGTNSVYASEASSVYNLLRYLVNFSSTSDYSPYSYLEASAIPADFLTSNADWWFAVKVESPMVNSSNGQVLFARSGYFTAYRGNGTYFMTSGTSGYLQTISPTTIVEAGEWIIYKYDASTTYYTGWVNGVKVLNASSAGVTPPSSAPTAIWFGSEEGTETAPSGYGYPLRDSKISTICIGSGDLSDSDAAQFTSSVFNPSSLTLTGGTITNQWSPAISDVITTDIGSVDLTLFGENISTEKI